MLTPPQRTTARCRDTATNPPTFRPLVHDAALMLSFQVPRERMCISAAAFIVNSLRPFMQILRKMINDESHFCLQSEAQYEPEY